MTSEELSALPEAQDYRIETLPNGVTVKHRIVIPFRQYTIKDDDIFMFKDKDGAWFVDYHLEGGPYKRRAFF